MNDVVVPRPTPWNEDVPKRPAESSQRFVAFLIDWGIVTAAYIVALIVASSAGGGAGVIFIIGAAGFAIYNMIYLQGAKGQTIGKKQQGIILLSDATGKPVGVGMAIVRMLLSSLFAIPCYLDHWWILVDSKNQRLSDKVLDYQVLKA